MTLPCPVTNRAIPSLILYTVILGQDCFLGVGVVSDSPYILHASLVENKLSREMLPDSELKNKAEYP